MGLIVKKVPKKSGRKGRKDKIIAKSKKKSKIKNVWNLPQEEQRAIEKKALFISDILNQMPQPKQKEILNEWRATRGEKPLKRQANHGKLFSVVDIDDLKFFDKYKTPDTIKRLKDDKIKIRSRILTALNEKETSIAKLRDNHKKLNIKINILRILEELEEEGLIVERVDKISNKHKWVNLWSLSNLPVSPDVVIRDDEEEERNNESLINKRHGIFNGLQFTKNRSGVTKKSIKTVINGLTNDQQNKLKNGRSLTKTIDDLARLSPFAASDEILNVARKSKNGVGGRKIKSKRKFVNKSNRISLDDLENDNF